MKTRSTGPTALAAGAALGAAVLLGPAFAQQAISQDEIRTPSPLRTPTATVT